MRLCSLLISRQNYNILSPNSYIHISVTDLYISRVGLSILLQPNMWTDPGCPASQVKRRPSAARLLPAPTQMALCLRLACYDF